MIKITSTQQEQVLTAAQSHTPLIDFYLLSLGISQQEIFLFVFMTGNGRDLHWTDPCLVLSLSADTHISHHTSCSHWTGLIHVTSSLCFLQL